MKKTRVKHSCKYCGAWNDNKHEKSHVREWRCSTCPNFKSHSTSTKHEHRRQTGHVLYSVSTAPRRLQGKGNLPLYPEWDRGLDTEVKVVLNKLDIGVCPTCGQYREDNSQVVKPFLKYATPETDVTTTLDDSFGFEFSTSLTEEVLQVAQEPEDLFEWLSKQDFSDFDNLPEAEGTTLSLTTAVEDSIPTLTIPDTNITSTTITQSNWPAQYKTFKPVYTDISPPYLPEW